MALRIVTPPSRPIVSLDDLKAYLHVDFADDDDLITSLAAAAGEAAENMVQRRYAPQSLEWIIERRCILEETRALRIPVAAGGGAAHMTVDSVALAGFNGTTATLDQASYVAKPCGETLAVCAVWPSFSRSIDWHAPEPLVIRFSITEDVQVPPVVQTFVKAYVKAWYDSGEISAVNTVHPLMWGEIWS